MKKQRSKTHRLVTPILPKALRRPVASMHAPDLWEVGEDGKKRRKRGVYIMDFMPGGKYARKSAAAPK
jgi:hypothetical protein